MYSCHNSLSDACVHAVSMYLNSTWTDIAQDSYMTADCSYKKTPQKTKKKTMSTMETSKYEAKHADKTFQVVFLHRDTLPYRRVLCCVRNTHNNPSNILVVEIF